MFKRISIAALLLSVSNTLCLAADEGGTRVEFSGTVVDPPSCTLNNNKVIEVNFGNVGIKQADGRRIAKTLDYNLQCKGNSVDKALRMMLIGQQDFADDVLATSIERLGIRFYQNGDTVTLNQWFRLAKVDNSMLLTASPIVQPGLEPQPGDFQASATLVVAYQ